MIAMDLPKWALEGIDKIKQNFLWKERQKAKGGICLVSWARISQPKSNMKASVFMTFRRLGSAVTVAVVPEPIYSILGAA